MAMQVDEAKLHQFMGNVLGQLTGATTVACGLVGHRLGLYKAMAGRGAMSADDVAKAATTHPRLTREWLDQQASVGFVGYDAGKDTYELSPEAAFALADESSPMFIAGGLMAFRAMVIDADRIVTAFKGDGGVPWSDHHEDLFPGTREFFRPAYQNFLTQAWVPALDGVVAKLEAGGHIADVGCGHGISTVLLAKRFPKAKITGFDFHPGSIAEATRHAREAGVTNATFTTAGAGDFHGSFDLICFCDCLHDMGDPVGIARHAKSCLAPGGSIMLVEPFAHGTRAQNHTGGLGGLMYGASTFVCTPCSLSQPGKRALGAQCGEPGMRAVFQEAGYGTFQRRTETPFNIVYQAKA
jgi:SAM-dependent methyltransferase